MDESQESAAARRAIVSQFQAIRKQYLKYLLFIGIGCLPAVILFIVFFIQLAVTDNPNPLWPIGGFSIIVIGIVVSYFITDRLYRCPACGDIPKEYRRAGGNAKEFVVFNPDFCPSCDCALSQDGLEIEEEAGGEFEEGETEEGIGEGGPECGKIENRSWSTIIGTIFVIGLAGYLLMIELAIPFYHSYRAGSWLTTQCTVDRAEVKVKNAKKGVTYCILIHYHYAFQQQTFYSSRVNFGNSPYLTCNSDKAAASAIAQQYTENPQICYVNTSHPIESVISRDFDRLRWVMIPVSLFMVLFAVFFMYKGAENQVINLKFWRT